jgi:type VI secretion system protein ImpA
MPLRDELLAPIPGANPGGVELRYDPLYDKIKEARREEEDIPQGDWQTTRKTADWPQVIKLTKDALANKSKDLQLAVWLAEATLRREGFAGFRGALDMLVGMLEQHWDHLYPEIEDGDLEMRAAPLEWLGLKLELPVKRVPLDRAGHDWIQIQDSRGVPTEADASADSGKAETREALLAEGKTPPEEVERAFQGTPKAWYRALVADIDGALEVLQNLDELSQERFGDLSPNYGTLRKALEEVQRTAKQLLKRKLELEPDPVGSAGAEVMQTEVDAVAIPPGVVLPGSVGAQLSATPTSREDAASRIAASAKYLRQADPTNPAPYLLLRGFRWGELRASGRNPDPRLLEAPATQTRTQLKSLLLDSKWEALLEACEGVMATPQGRGWLDLQRYALTACDELGSEYQIVGAALRGALRSLLEDLPALVDMTMMDDTPTANRETREWLKTIVSSDDSAASSDESAEAPAPELPRARDARAAALAEVRAGRTDRAIALLMREASHEKSRRGRFLLQTELANVMVGAGHHAVAQPILEELIASVETHKLEEWESGEIVARPLALLYRCLEKADGDMGTRSSLYLRICRLDPLQAIGFSQNGGGADDQA